jgi:hypothetical protein
LDGVVGVVEFADGLRHSCGCGCSLGRPVGFELSVDLMKVVELVDSVDVDVVFV